MYTLPPPPVLQCVIEEAQKQSVDPVVFLAILRHEAGKDGQAIPTPRGRYDLGRAGINTINIPEIARVLGIEPTADALYRVAKLIMDDPCVNVSVGTWLLGKWTRKSNGNIWEAVGRYHAPYNKQLADRYRQKVYADYVVIERHINVR